MSKSLTELDHKTREQEQVIESLKSIEKTLVSQIKNQKHLELEKGVEEIMKAKDTHI